MDPDLAKMADLYFQETLGLDVESMVQAIPGEAAAGPSLHQDHVFRDIRQNRKSEDERLPRRDWEGEPRKANWHRVADCCVEALSEQSKDLRLAGWLMEARIQLDGLAALAPGLVLIHSLNARFKEQLHPKPLEGDYDHQVNFYHWLNESITHVCKQQPLSGDGVSGFGWADWEQAHHNEQLLDKRVVEAVRGQTLLRVQTIAEDFSRTDSDTLNHQMASLALASCAVEFLSEQLGHTPFSDRVSLSNLHQWLDDAAGLVGSELERRGEGDVPVSCESIDGANESRGIPEVEAQGSEMPSGTFRSRQQAYEQLDAAARFLAHVEPHSPVPYLVAKAIEWGQLNAAELYQRVFIEHEGQISISEMMNLSSGRHESRQAS